MLVLSVLLYTVKHMWIELKVCTNESWQMVIIHISLFPNKSLLHVMVDTVLFSMDGLLSMISYRAKTVCCFITMFFCPESSHPIKTDSSDYTSKIFQSSCNKDKPNMSLVSLIILMDKALLDVFMVAQN